MKNFESLEEHIYFKECKEYEKMVKYEFGQKDKILFAHGVLYIPKNESVKMSWMYREVTVDINRKNYFLDSTENNIQDIPKNWFFEIVKEVAEKVEKRDRLRVLFSRK